MIVTFVFNDRIYSTLLPQYKEMCCIEGTNMFKTCFLTNFFRLAQSMF